MTSTKRRIHMSNISNKSVVEKGLELLNLKDFRHPFVDHCSKKLLTGATISLLVAAELQKWKSLSYIEQNLRSSPVIQNLVGVESVHASSINRKIDKLPFDFLLSLCETIFRKIDDCYSKKKSTYSSFVPITIIDSSQIKLPSKAGEWAYCSKDSNTIKIHMKLASINETITYPKKVIYSTGMVDDKEVVIHLVTDKDTTYVMDRGYIHYHHFHLWQQENISFVARIKANSKLTMVRKRPIAADSLIKTDADVEVKDHSTQELFPLRLVEYQDDQKRPYRVVTNRRDLSAEEIADIYKRRWLIELFFKWIKQNLNTIKLYSYKQKAVWNQICITMIAYGLAELIRIQTKTTRSLREIVELLRIYLEKSWDLFLNELNRQPSRKSKGRKKKGKPGRPRKYPKKMKAQKIIVNS